MQATKAKCLLCFAESTTADHILESIVSSTNICSVSDYSGRSSVFVATIEKAMSLINHLIEEKQLGIFRFKAIAVHLQQLELVTLCRLSRHSWNGGSRRAAHDWKRA
jgi:hypothetical protein